jgi:hypothetical protein
MIRNKVLSEQSQCAWDSLYFVIDKLKELKQGFLTRQQTCQGINWTTLVL